ncbi:alpha/beta fold hydrolase [Cognatilysobacter tabacisoli]|uniref:alpha/beta fold hydrolase n=1 Tax=Cognatilysobacter tabacisoli TaxID=2315424 RepID=UPI000E6B361F|nr:alpha/beta hydrolase [Lysobacter tabacisoli]
MRFVAAAVLAAVLGAAALVASDPYALVRAQFARQRVATGLDKATVDVAGHRWVYAHADDAPPGAPLVVMVHGFTGSKENWYPLAERLRDRYRVVVPDLPGWGESQRIAGADYGFGAQAERVAAFIERIAGDAPTGEVVLLGHSMGGGIAALVAARHWDLVDRIGLLDAAGVRFADNRFGVDVLAGRNPFEVTDAASLDAYLDVLFQRDDARPWIPWPASRGYIDRRRAQASFEQDVLARIGRGPERFAPGDAAVGIRQPALLLWGAQDRVIDPSAMGLYAQRMPHATQVLIDDAGHMALMEHPDAVAAAVTALIERGRPR